MLDVGPLGSFQLDTDATDAFLALENHLRRGRDGAPWCVWAVHALDRNAFWVGDARKLGDTGLGTIVALAAEAFVKRCPAPDRHRLPEDALLNTLTVLLRDDIPCDDAEKILQEERPALLRRGLMAGLLHPRSTHRPLTPGPSGMPYRTDSPFLTVRWAVTADELFVGINQELRALLQTWTMRRQEDHETTA
jgi:hypothetical protein